VKNNEVKPVTTAQIKKIHVLLNQRGLMDKKRDLIHQVSDGRTSSAKELTVNEARYLINFLLDEEGESKKLQAVFRAIYFLAFKMDIIYGETDEDYHMNIAKLNMFCRERGSVKKNLTEQNLIEMRKTHRQFEAMYTKFNNKKRNEKVSIK
jgi:hypothetical protein